MSSRSWAVVLWFVVAPALAFGAQEDRRRIADFPLRPIPDLLQPGDVSVTLAPGFVEPLVAWIDSSMPAADLLRAHLQDADWVVVGRAAERRAHLTADQTWIVTSTRIDVAEQLKPRPGRIAPVIEVDEWGGSLSVNGVSVTAVAWEQQRLSIGDTYLLFVIKTREGARVDWSYRINHDRRLESTFPAFISGEAFDTAHGLSLERARAILRGRP